MNKIIYLLIVLSGSFFTGRAQVTATDKKISIINFNVYEKDEKLIIDWATGGTVPTNYWQVQQSTDGAAFATIAIVLGPDPRKAGDQYEYREKIKAKVKRRATWYRLCHVDINGNQQVSEIIKPAK